MAKHKLRRFSEMETFPNTIQSGRMYPPADNGLKGNWNEKFFKNNNNLVLELGCGRGEYSVYFAENFPEKNIIGIDIKGARLWRGAKTAMEKGFTNAGFLRIQIEHLLHFFASDEVSEIWITFPDPQPQESREKKRLTSPAFLEMYKNILKPNGVVHLKTDSQFLFEYTRDLVSKSGYTVLDSIENIYAQEKIPDELNVRTTYEEIFAKEGSQMFYLKFSFS